MTIPRELYHIKDSDADIFDTQQQLYLGKLWGVEVHGVEASITSISDTVTIYLWTHWTMTGIAIKRN